MSPKPLHPVQKQLLKLLARHSDEPLTIRELQFNVGASSTSVIAHHLDQLEKKGHLKRNPHNAKDYQIVSGDPEEAIAHINLYGMAGCGPSGSILDGDPIDRIPMASRLLNFPVSEAFMVQARGKSMEPKIYEGDFVVARKAEIPKDGKMYVCVNDEECLIKIIRILGDQILLESINRSQFGPIRAEKDFRVEGEVRHIISGKI